MIDETTTTANGTGGNVQPLLVEQPAPAELDEDEAEFNAIRRDLPGVKGASAAGIVTLVVSKAPNKNAFFRTHPNFMPIAPIVTDDAGMEKHFFTLTPAMEALVADLGMTVAEFRLYLTTNAVGGLRIIPVRLANKDGEQNDWDRTKELALLRGVEGWVRMFADMENHSYQVFPAPAGRYGEPQWPELTEAKIFRLAFRDRGHLIDSPEHFLIRKWAGRDAT